MTVTAHEYEFLTTENIPDYIASQPELARRIDSSNIVECKEVGDGNLNVVFIVTDGNGESLVLKQSLPYVRMTGEGWPMTPERANREAHALARQYGADPVHTVSLFKHDPDRYVIAMEDLSSYTVWRTALNNGERHEGAARQVGEFVARLAFATSVYGMDRFDYAQAVAETQNPDLCTITEDLVFTEPAFDIGRNEVLPANEPDARALAEDSIFVAAMGQAKFMFMTHAEALIHGDLHTGSVMVRQANQGELASSDVRVFDPEFAFYGPVAFDVGAVFANFTFASARARALGEDERAQWCLDQVHELWEGFEVTFRELWAGRENPTVWDSAHCEWQLGQWLRESTLFASAKMARRIVGAAKVTDIQTLAPAVREHAARAVLRASRACAAGWQDIHASADFTRLVGDELTAIGTSR